MTTKGLRRLRANPARGILSTTPTHRYDFGDFMLAIGVLFIPVVFAWFTLQSRYDISVRVLAFAWMFGFIALGLR